MTPVPRHDQILITEDMADTHRRRLLADTQMDRATHLLPRIEVGDRLLDHADPQHLSQQFLLLRRRNGHGMNQKKSPS